jgi:hypothetical protein
VSKFRACDCCDNPGLWGLDYYMVEDVVWREADLKQTDMRCLRCLSTALGRPLNAEDFTSCSLNDVITCWFMGVEPCPDWFLPDDTVETIIPVIQDVLGRYERDGIVQRTA